MAPEILLIWALALPLIGGGLTLCFSRIPNLREGSTIVVALALLLVVSQLLSHTLNGETTQLTLFEMLPGLSLSFKIEPLGMMFAGIAALLWPINSLYSIGYMRGNKEENQTRFYLFFSIAIFGVMGVAFAGNLLTLFVFYEVLTLSTFPLVTHKGNENALAGGRVYLGILLTTSIGLLLPAIIWIWSVAGTTDFTAGGILYGKISGIPLTVLTLLIIFGVGKAAVMPVHRWLPAAMVAPTPVSALLHAVAVVKAGVFSVVKIVVYIIGVDTLTAAPWADLLWILPGFTIIVASVVALNQDNLKKRLAYSTIGQLSYVVLGTLLIAPFSIKGAALHIVAHAFGKITLFFAAGSIYTSCKKTEISQLNGIGWRMPFTMSAFTIGAISMIGLPPAAGFLSKWYLLLGAFEVDQIAAVCVIIISTLLNTAYFMPVIHAAWFRKESNESVLTYGEAPWPIVGALLLTATLTILLFLFPSIPFSLISAIPL